jgi:ribosomal-protein-alanine N-acetyltransferase
VVARAALTVRIEPMELADLPEVLAIERASFPTPWPPNAYASELRTNRMATYLVARVGGRVVAYGGMWVMVDEAHITTFAVHPDWRRRRIGERLLLALLDVAQARHAREATLEVRVSNLPARRLYEKYGFRPVGIRPRYYTDNNEDALIMTTAPFNDPAMRDRLARLRAALEAEEGVGDAGRGATAGSVAGGGGAAEDRSPVSGADPAAGQPTPLVDRTAPADKAEDPP